VSSREAREERRGLAKLIYSMNPSLDGFISGPDGNFDWSAPDEELHRFHNERIRALGGHLLGRRLYETMVYWETAHEDPAVTDYMREFADIWQDLPKGCSRRPSRKSWGTRGWLAAASLKRPPD
jgi:hypothetical protein